jgi:hypothetical protein
LDVEASTKGGREKTDDRYLVLLEVPSVLLVDEDQIEVVSGGELLVDVSEGRGEFEPAEEESDRDRFACAEANEDKVKDTHVSE